MTLQSASATNSYRGVLTAPTDGTDNGGRNLVALTCTVQDSLGGKALASAWVEVDPNPVESKDPAAFLAGQIVAIEALLDGNTVRAGEPPTNLALLTLSQCVNTLNSADVTSSSSSSSSASLTQAAKVKLDSTYL